MTKRFFQACIGTTLLILVGVACNDVSQAPVDQNLRVLGFYEFEFVNTEEGWVSTVRETPLETLGLSPQDLARIPPIGNGTPILEIATNGGPLKGANGSSALTPGGDSIYIAGRYRVTNNTATALDNITFLAYHSGSTFSDPTYGTVSMREGTALSVAKDPNGNDVDPRLVTPSHRYRYRAPSSHGTTADSGRYEAVSGFSDLVLYDENDTNFTGIKSTLESDFSFVETVFPYGFVVRDSTVNPARRTVNAGADGFVTFGFRGGLPLSTGIDKIRFHAVAVTDSVGTNGDTRITQGIEENYRLNTISATTQQPDGWQAVIDRYLAAGIGPSGALDKTGNKISFAGTMQSGERLGLGIPCEDFAPIVDVRIAGDPTDPDGYFGNKVWPVVNMIDYSNNNSGPIQDITPLPASTPTEDYVADCDELNLPANVRFFIDDELVNNTTQLTEGVPYTLRIELDGSFTNGIKLYVSLGGNGGFITDNSITTNGVITVGTDTSGGNNTSWSGLLQVTPYTNSTDPSVPVQFEVSSGTYTESSDSFTLNSN